MNACFTGHRPHKLNGYDMADNIDLLVELRSIIIDRIENKNVTKFISGMALGIDMWSALIVLKLKEKYPHIKLISAVPCEKQWSKWDIYDVEIWNNIIDKADIVHYVSSKAYTAHYLQERNEWMVDNSDFMIGVWNGSSGGTANCVRYAKKKGLPVTILNPDSL